MSITEAERVFRPRPSVTETKAINTTSAARAIMDEEVAAPERKTARLQIARLEREAVVAAAPPPVPAANPKRRMAAKKS